MTGAPGAFRIGTTGYGTTTLGTWMTSIPFNDYAKSAYQNYGDYINMEGIEPSETDNIIIMDTEGLGYRTNQGENYDIVTITPNTLIAENIFLVVNDRLKPKELGEVITKVAVAATKARGGFEHRDHKIFNRLTIIINKCQEVDLEETDVMRELKRNHKTTMAKIAKYFKHQLEVVVLPHLHWDEGKGFIHV